MVVHSISATATPPRPSSVSLAFRMKQRNGGAGLSSARRALSALGNNNAQINLRLAESLLTITQDNFMKKWNFDPVKEAPMAPGRFHWASVSSVHQPAAVTTVAAQEPSSIITANRDISTCFTLPCHQDISSRVPEPHSTSPASSSSSSRVVEADSGVESDDSVIEESDTTTTAEEEPPTAAATRQTTITDYLNPRKRSSSHLDCSDSLHLPASKKRLLLAN